MSTPTTTTPEWQHRLVMEKDVPRSYGPGRRIAVEAGLHYIHGNGLPYFSVTGEIGKRGARDCDMCGCIHEEVLRFFPKLAPIVALHLSDSTGVPMHAESNGWYQLAGYLPGNAGERYHAGNSERHFPLPAERLDPTKPWQTTEYRQPTPDECLASFAEHVRLPVDYCRTLVDGWIHGLESDTIKTIVYPWYRLWIDAQRPRWQGEADNAIVLLDRINRTGK